MSATALTATALSAEDFTATVMPAIVWEATEGASSEEYSGEDLAMSAVTDTELWHRRLRHPNELVMRAAEGMKALGVHFNSTLPACAVCEVSKSTQATTRTQRIIKCRDR